MLNFLLKGSISVGLSLHQKKQCVYANTRTESRSIKYEESYLANEIPSSSPLIRFSRPHTMIGTMVSVFSVTWMAMDGPKLAPLFIMKFFHALVPALLLNISIVGLNQLYDKRIDKINKPYLPLVTGEISTDFALSFISLCLSVGLYYGVTTNSASIMFTLVGSCLLGVFYSVDINGLRWKRFPILAAACIVGVRSIMVQLGFFFYAVDNFLVDIPLKIVFATIYMMFYSIIISILKDIPDFVGDKDQKIKTLTVLIGAFELCTCFLITLYLSGTLSCMFCSNLMRGILVFSLHTLSAILIWRKSGISRQLSGNPYFYTLLLSYFIVNTFFFCCYIETLNEQLLRRAFQ